jgi:hypothetical protein
LEILEEAIIERDRFPSYRTRVLSAPSAQDSVPLWATMWGWTFGSPCPIELADGTVLVSFFAMDLGGVYAVRCVRLRT